MSGILTPGYLRWDGTKYVLDEDVEIVGPSGSAGPPGPPGPAGPPGPFGTASGDLLGTYPGPISVVGLTGVLGVVNFGVSITNPTITQVATAGTTGLPMTLRAQNATLLGGSITIQSGTGTTAGVVQFLVGNTLAAFFDANTTFRFGPNANSTVTGPNGISPLSGTDYMFGNNASGSMLSELFSSSVSQRAGYFAYNAAGGGTNVSGISIQAPGTTFTVGSYQGQGVIEQAGPATSAIVLSKVLGDGTSRAVTGRIFQTGAWGIGDTGGSSSGNQIGLNGPLLNFGRTTGSLTSGSFQASIFNTDGSSPFGNLNLQGHVGVNLISQTTLVASTITTKFISNVGRRIKVRATTTTPDTMTASDEVVSIGTITTGSVATTIAAGSNGVALPTGTINVASTTGFASSGAILVLSSQGAQTVTYTGTGATTFTGCSGGTGTLSTGGTVNALFTVNLPSGPTSGDIYTVKDANGSAGQNNIAVIGNGNNIDGASSVILSINYSSLVVAYNGTSWTSQLVTNVTPTAGYSSVVNVVSGGSANVVGFDQLLLCDPTSASCTIQMPANPTVNMRVTVKDATAKSNVNPIIMQGNGRTLENPISPGTYASPVNITSASLSATWTFDPTRNRFTLV